MSTYILAIDSATEACSVALLRDGKTFTKFTVSNKEHARKILPMVNQCLIDAHLKLKNINVLAFCRGPGSFVGVRIAIGIAQGLAFGANIPMIGVSSLLTMAQGAFRKLGVEKVLVAINAKMGEIYSACYELKLDGCWDGEETESLIKPEEFLKKINKLSGRWAIVGTGWSDYPILKMTNLNLLETGIFLSNAQDMLFLALKKCEKGKLISAEEAFPIYLYNEVSWKKLYSL
ncbi:MAG: tRNA (adenosine(37)-N6)-threonylcarbamoyltransferase complex dimerization subunit type 1 TsaB [Arsenophonus sp.]